MQASVVKIVHPHPEEALGLSPQSQHEPPHLGTNQFLMPKAQIMTHLALTTIPQSRL